MPHPRLAGPVSHDQLAGPYIRPQEVDLDMGQALKPPGLGLPSGLGEWALVGLVGPVAFGSWSCTGVVVAHWGWQKRDSVRSLARSFCRAGLWIG
jgi:hypothetical protein